MLKNRMLKIWSIILTGTLVAVGVSTLIVFTHPALAGGGSITARAQFRTTDPSGTDNPNGTMTLTEEGAEEIFKVQIKNLDDAANLSIYVSPTNSFVGTNSVPFTVAPLFRDNIKNGTWSQKLTGTGGAPLEFQLVGVADLTDLSGVSYIGIGNPGATNILNGTNFITCIQTSSNGITITTCTTNIVGGTTNVLINTFAWAPVPPLLAKPSASSFHASFKLQQPAIPPDPHAKGKVHLSYNGSSGRSQLNINLNGLIPGQGYTLWLSDGGSNYSANVFPLSSGGSAGQGRTARMRLDTSMGDSLPIQVPSTADLTNRVFSVRDATGFIYLFGSLP